MKRKARKGPDGNAHNQSFRIHRLSHTAAGGFRRLCCCWWCRCCRAAPTALLLPHTHTHFFVLVQADWIRDSGVKLSSLNRFRLLMPFLCSSLSRRPQLQLHASTLASSGICCLPKYITSYGRHKFVIGRSKQFPTYTHTRTHSTMPATYYNGMCPRCSCIESYKLRVCAGSWVAVVGVATISFHMLQLFD